MMQSSALRNRSPPRPPGTTKLPDTVTIREYREDDAPAFIGLIRELQSYELPFTRHLKRPEDIGAWYVDLVKQQCAKLDGIILMAECERLARFSGRAEITLAVGAGNEMAHQLYRRSGYEAMKIRMSKLLA